MVTMYLLISPTLLLVIGYAAVAAIGVGAIWEK